MRRSAVSLSVLACAVLALSACKRTETPADAAPPAVAAAASAPAATGDAAVAANYLKPVSYPLPLDVALPLFSWGVVFDRDKNYRGLARELPPNLNDPAAFERVSPIMYKALKPARWNGNGMYAGEYLRVERTEPAELDKLVKQAGQALGTVKTVIYYHLDEAVLAPYSKDALQNAADALR